MSTTPSPIRIEPVRCTQLRLPVRSAFDAAAACASASAGIVVPMIELYRRMRRGVSAEHQGADLGGRGGGQAQACGDDGREVAARDLRDERAGRVGAEPLGPGQLPQE